MLSKLLPKLFEDVVTLNLTLGLGKTGRSVQVSDALKEAARSIKVRVWLHNEHPYLGEYKSAPDFIILNALDSMRNGVDPNVVLAHEIIHATGHRTRLARIAIVEGFGFGYPSCWLREERTAQYGAQLLIQALKLEVPTIESETVDYMRRMGRPCGTPDVQDREDAERAVEYVMQALQQRRAEVA